MSIQINPNITQINKDGRDYKVIGCEKLTETTKYGKSHYRVLIKFLDDNTKHWIYLDYNEKIYKITSV